jgi:hypothetical protein
MTDGTPKPRTREEVARLIDAKLAEHILGGKADWSKDAHGNNDHPLPVDDVVTAMTALMADLLGIVDQSDGIATPDGAPVHVDDVMANLGDFADRIDRHGFVNAMGGHAQELRKAVTALAAKGDVDPWHWCDTRKPDEGRRVVILYEDGSGAFIGYWTGETLIDHDGEDYGWREEPGAMWAYLPKGFRLWCEDRQDDPFTFPTDKT